MYRRLNLLPLLRQDVGLDSGASGDNPGAETLQRQPITRFADVDANAAATMPYDELRRLAREEARNYNPDESTPVAEDSGENPDDDANASISNPPETTQQSGDNTSQQSQQQSTGNQDNNPKRPETVEDALRQLDSVRGNLNTAIEERKALQKQIADYQAAQQQREAEAQQEAIRRQHQEALQRIAALPQQQQEIAQQRYMNGVSQAALNDFARDLQRQQQEVANARLTQAKQQLPAMFEDIADFVATQHEVPADTLKALVKQPGILQMIQAANNEDGLTAVAATVGELLDVNAKTIASQRAAEKERRRQAAIAGQRVQRDAPNGVAASGGNVSEVNKIMNMSPAEFAAYKKAQIRANR